MNTTLDNLTEKIIGAAIEVHKELGRGLLKSAYQKALAHEFGLRGIRFEEQKYCPITYKRLQIPDAYVLDFLVEKLVVVELKALAALQEAHDAQLLTYLRFSKCSIGLLMNFHAPTLVQGLHRLVL